MRAKFKGGAALCALAAVFTLFTLSACGTGEAATWTEATPEAGVSESAPLQTKESTMEIKIEVGGETFTAVLAENEAARELADMLPLTLELSDYGGFEKVGPLGASLTTSNRQITTSAGDIVLYSGNQIVMFYGSNSWSYTPLARVEDLTGWAEALGSGGVTVRIEAA